MNCIVHGVAKSRTQLSDFHIISRAAKVKNHFQEVGKLRHHQDCLRINEPSLLGQPGIVPSLRLSAVLIMDVIGSPYTCVFAWIKDLNVGPNTIKLLEENRKHLLNTDLGNGFLDMRPEAQTTEARISKQDYIILLMCFFAVQKQIPIGSSAFTAAMSNKNESHM